MRFLPLLLLLTAATQTPEQLAMERVKAQLKDPDSAKFKGLRIEADGHGCGWVNAKNAFGGYIGFAVFYIGRDGKVALLPPELSEPQLCP